MTELATLPIDLPPQRRQPRSDDVTMPAEAGKAIDDIAEDAAPLPAQEAVLDLAVSVVVPSIDVDEAANIEAVEPVQPNSGTILQLDPADCFVGEANARDTTALGYDLCETLIKAIIAAEGVIEPLVVRLTKDGRYEILCGARRHWAVSWLRANGHPDMMLPAILREAGNEEAFRIAELEHHGGEDLSAIEHGQSYARALRRHYRGDQKRMAEALSLRQATVSVLVALAGWPADVLAAYASPHDVLEADAARINPLLGRAGRRELVIAEAAKLKIEQARRREAGEPPIGRAAVTARLLGAGRCDKGPLTVTDADGDAIVTMRSRAGDDGYAVVVRGVDRRDPLLLGRALQYLIEQHTAGRRGTVVLGVEVGADGPK